MARAAQVNCGPDEMTLARLDLRCARTGETRPAALLALARVGLDVEEGRLVVTGRKIGILYAVGTPPTRLREATPDEELRADQAAAKSAGGEGIITVDGRRCFVVRHALGKLRGIGG